jgi:hypothetical protein
MIRPSRVIPAGAKSAAEICVLEPIGFHLDRREVLRLLGYGPRARPPAPRIARIIDECIREAETMFEPRGCYAFGTLDAVRTSGPFRGAERIAFGVSTIGRRLPERVTELARRGESARALVLDAIGSAAVEAAADVVNAAICERVAQDRMFTNRRISPGYPGWGIEGQREIFALLPSEVTGVRLTTRSFMQPRKSVSFAVSVGSRVRHSKYATICAYCNLRGCRYRREARAAAGGGPHG